MITQANRGHVGVCGVFVDGRDLWAHRLRGIMLRRRCVFGRVGGLSFHGRIVSDSARGLADPALGEQDHTRMTGGLAPLTTEQALGFPGHCAAGGRSRPVWRPGHRHYSASWLPIGGAPPIGDVGLSQPAALTPRRRQRTLISMPRRCRYQHSQAFQNLGFRFRRWAAQLTQDRHQAPFCRPR